jgi:hypothetical protein
MGRNVVIYMLIAIKLVDECWKINEKISAFPGCP